MKTQPFKDNDKYFYLKYRELNQEQVKQVDEYYESPAFRNMTFREFIKAVIVFQFNKKDNSLRGAIMAL